MTDQSAAQSLQQLIDDLARRIASVTESRIDETVAFARAYAPLFSREVARLQLARSLHDTAGIRRAELNISHLKARAWIDAAVYGVQVQAHTEQAFMAALDFVLKVK